MKLRPLQDRVLIRRVDPEAKSTRGIIIPDTVQEKPMEGEVLAGGPGVRDAGGALHALDVKSGDRVLFGKWSGNEFKLDGKDLMVVKESDILGIIDQAAAKQKAASSIADIGAAAMSTDSTARPLRSEAFSNWPTPL
jgi:chaperonin GroES